MRGVKVLSKFKPIVIVGPSGVGKSALIFKLVNQNPFYFIRTISHTSRKKLFN